MDPSQLIENMSYHSPDEQTQKEIEDLRAAFHELAHKVSSRCPDGRAKSLAQTKLEEALMWGVKSMVIPGA